MNRSQRRSVNGILIIDKPKGLSSNAALQKVKRIFNAQKAGHTGSLDPLATGILPICFGRATKLADKLLASDKRYLATAKLGIATETGDAEGAIVATKEVCLPSDEELNKIIQEFQGEQQQIPSMYSALKQNGVPLYKLARQGIVVERAARTINIFHIEIISIDRENNILELDVSCTKGTYIRTLVEDIGNRLGCGAHIADLRRTAAGPYTMSDMHTIEDIEQKLAGAANEYSDLDGLLRW